MVENHRRRHGTLVLPLVALPMARQPPAARTPPAAPGTPPELQPWIAAVNVAADACLVLSADARLVAASHSAAALFARSVGDILGRRLVGDTISVIDFTAAARPGDDYADRIAPVLVLRSGAPARGLLRIALDDGSRLTLDAVAAPLRGADGNIAGSVSFLAAVPVS